MQVDTGRMIERYVVEGVLGSGGMATVYLVRHRHLGTQHALKVLTHLGPSAELRLMLEGKVQAALHHPNVVAVTDILDVGGTPGLLMEYVPPPSLAAWLAEHQPSLEQAESLFRGIVDGVRHAHRYGLVHRDLKPSNVLLARYDGECLVPKVCDFGLAKLLSDEPAVMGQTRSGLTMGTPLYMAPEQFRDAKKVDRRADMFSLGCILYELLAGRPPFAWTDFIQLYNEITGREYPRLPDHVPERMVEAVDGLLDPDRDTRLADCDALLSVLDGKGRPVQVTMTPKNLGRGGDVPMLRDRLSSPVTPVRGPPRTQRTETPAGDAFTAFSPGLAPPTLALDSSAIGDVGPNPMPTVLAAPPTMSPEDPAPSPDSAPPAWRLSAGVGFVLLLGVTFWSYLPRDGAPTSMPTGSPQSAVAQPPAPIADLVPVAPPVTVPPPVTVIAPQGQDKRPVDRPTGSVVPPPPVDLPIHAVPPAVATTGHIDLDPGTDASRVEALGPAGRVLLPAELPAGAYEIYAWFPDAPNTHTDRVLVAAGDRVRLRCMSFSMRCVKR
ncbi:MAG: serine/threonine protein kinase [Myxococcales bacterium]|nr:serine/threonine protein kinase [Myxococcales bacterium]